MKLHEIMQQPSGFTPPSIDVEITKVGKYRSGTSEHGEWSFQNVEVSDGSGTAYLSLKSIGEMPASKIGKMARISCKHSSKHGLTGLRVQHDEKNGKKYSSIVVTSSALWTWLSDKDEPAQPAPRPIAQAEDTGSERASAIEHLKECQKIAIELALMAKAADAPPEAIITGNQVVMFFRDNGVLLTPGVKQAEEDDGDQLPQQKHDIADDDIPF